MSVVWNPSEVIRRIVPRIYCKVNIYIIPDLWPIAALPVLIDCGASGTRDVGFEKRFDPSRCCHVEKEMSIAPNSCKNRFTTARVQQAVCKFSEIGCW